MVELKNCPFCGGKAELHRPSIAVYAICSKCGISTSYIYPPEEAVRRWNNRSAEEALQERIAKLEKELEQMRTVALGYCELARRLQESLDESNRYWDKALVEARKLTESSEGD